jgi:hypothetical protein
VDNKEHQAIFYRAIKNIFLPVSGHAIDPFDIAKLLRPQK